MEYVKWQVDNAKYYEELTNFKPGSVSTQSDIDAIDSYMQHYNGFQTSDFAIKEWTPRLPVHPDDNILDEIPFYSHNGSTNVPIVTKVKKSFPLAKDVRNGDKTISVVAESIYVIPGQVVRSGSIEIVKLKQ